MKLKDLYKDFTTSEKTSGIILMFCTILSLVLANSSVGPHYLRALHTELFSKPLEFWINDGLMTIFFLLVGLEIEREIYIGELADRKKSMLPVLAAIGGMIVPALIHFSINKGASTQNGFGIPMATDIAFSLAILSLLGKKVPLSLKVFLTALAIIDDLGAIIVIALFYSKGISFVYLSLAAAVFIILLILNRLKAYFLWIYLLLGMFMWFFMYRSGIHPTITGVLLAFAIPFGKGDVRSVSHKLQHRLHQPVAFLVLPLFALANTAIFIPSSFMQDLSSLNSLGIILGLCLGKPMGIFCFSLLGILLGWCVLPEEIKKQHLLWIGCIAGIGFTMSIFITLLAFTGDAIIASSKIAIILASLLSGLAGYIGLQFSLRSTENL